MIQIGIDKRCADVITVDAKSYVMLGHDGKFVKKGQTLRGRNSEVFLAGLKNLFIQAIFSRDYDRCIAEYARIRDRIEQYRLGPQDVSQKAQLNMSLDEYRRKVEMGANKSAAYELASNATRHYGKGDQIYYYVADPGYETVMVRNKEVTRKRKLKKFESVELIENFCWDYDVNHYVERLDKATKILILVFGLDRFKQMYPNIKIRKKDTNKLDKRQTKLHAVRQLIDGDRA